MQKHKDPPKVKSEISTSDCYHIVGRMTRFIMHEVIDIKGRCYDPLTELATFPNICLWDDGRKT